MDLVVGATGVLGGEICHQLVAEGRSIRAVVRQTSDAGRVSSLKQMGAELVEADLKVHASLNGACEGIENVITTATTTISRQPGDTIQSVDLEGQRNLVDAARANGVRHFVYISYSADIDRDDPCPLTVAKRTIERHLQESGMTYSILQPSIFMDIWLSPALGFDYANARAQISGTGEARLSWIAVRDVARFAVLALSHPSFVNATWELGGPDALSPLEVVRLFEGVGGRQYELSHVPEEALRAQRATATEPLEQSFAALMLANAAGYEVDLRPLLEACPVDLMSVREYAEAALAAQRVS